MSDDIIDKQRVVGVTAMTVVDSNPTASLNTVSKGNSQINTAYSRQGVEAKWRAKSQFESRGLFDLNILRFRSDTDSIFNNNDPKNVFTVFLEIYSPYDIKSNQIIKSIYLPAQYRKTRLNMKPLIIQTRLV